MVNLAFIGAAVCEIVGCYAAWVVLRFGRSALWLLPGLASLCLFSYLLTLVDSAAAGRAFAAYGGVYIAASLLWLRLVEGVQLDTWDVMGAAVVLTGAAILLWAPHASS